MHHPGPPRFLATGERTELAPRDPNPDGPYAWRVADAPPDSEATVGDGPVTEFTPDVPGRYLLGLDAPDGDHLLTVRAFPASYEGVDVAGGSGTAIRDRDADDAPRDYAAQGRHEGVGRPRVRVDASVAFDGDADGAGEHAGEAVFTAVPSPNPESSLDADDLTVTFVVDDRDVADAVAAGRTNPRDALHTSEDGRELRVPLDAVPDRLRVHAVAVARDPGEDPRVSVADAAAVERAAGDRAAADEAGGSEAVRVPDAPDFETVRLNDPPEWTREASVYEVFVRTFADADEGEAFDAIAERIP
ncbi:alpha-amylase, partial [Halorubrum sp. SS5]